MVKEAGRWGGIEPWAVRRLGLGKAMESLIDTADLVKDEDLLGQGDGPSSSAPPPEFLKDPAQLVEEMTGVFAAPSPSLKSRPACCAFDVASFLMDVPAVPLMSPPTSSISLSRRGLPLRMSASSLHRRRVCRVEEKDWKVMVSKLKKAGRGL